mgnify:FL=1
MAMREAFRFMRELAEQPDVLATLRDKPKSDVMCYAQSNNYDFKEAEFDDCMWGIEIYLANKIGENFDFNFSLWETMWGKYYLEFLVVNSIGAVTDADIDAYIAQQENL